MSFHRISSTAALSLALVAGLALGACGQTTNAEPEPQTKEEYTREPSDGGETVTIKPRTPFVAKHTEVTVSVDLGRKVTLAVEPETAIIFADPEDERLVEQVLWRVECRMDGKLISCPDRVRLVTIKPKEGCSRELFGPGFEIDLGRATAVASGEPNLDVYYEEMKQYQARVNAMREKDASLTDFVVDCGGDRRGQTRSAPEGIDPYNGITWQYDVILAVGKDEVVLDPEIWVEKDADPG